MVKASLCYFTFLTLLLTYIQFQVNAAPSGPLVKHLSSIIKWTRSSAKSPHQSDGNVLQFEDGYIVETVVEGNDLGFVPHSIRVSQDGELFAVDAVNSNVVRITPPLSQYSRGRLVAGSFQGKTGHVDGKPSDARFNHPKGVTMDDKGNVYVADTSNLAIRKISEAGVTTIAGGKSNVPGYRDGPSDDAKFSSDFDVIYVQPTCSLLVVDRGNAALRQISLNHEDCNYEYSSVSATDIFMVFGAILVGYATCMLQQGFGSSFFSKMLQQGNVEAEHKEQPPSKEKPVPVAETLKQEQEAGWPSFGQLVWDLFKLAFESLGNVFVSFIPFQFRHKGFRKGLTPLKDSLVMPEDQVEPPVVQKQRTLAPLSETRQAHTPIVSDKLVQKQRTPASLSETRQSHTPIVSDKLVQKQRTPAPLSETRQAHTPIVSDKFAEVKPHKIRSSSLKDPSLSTKHRSSRRQEYAEYYGSTEVTPYVQVRSKSQKDRSKHRQRDKSGEVNFGSSGTEPKPAEMKPVNYDDPKYDHYNIRNKYGDSYCFD